ncbi:MAG: BtrH N-terminal domain-containing protein, partial [Anaerolineales bacterium]
MTVLKDYNHYNGRHWETGSVRNYYAYRGVKAPHSGQPYSEALLLGVSGGIVMGYFSFAYEGYDPQARILTRNTFDPWDTMLGRLGAVQNVAQTSSLQTAIKKLEETLEAGVPAIVWADMFSLPYNALPQDEGMWAMMPVLVYGYSRAENHAWIADRASAPLVISAEELDQARGRVKKHKHRLITLEPPDPGKLAGAVQKGIWDCIKL